MTSVAEARETSMPSGDTRAESQCVFEIGGDSHGLRADNEVAIADT